MQQKISKISLIGHMGSGKTTIGKLIQKKLLYSFIDSDYEIEKKLQLSINDIFKQFGEEYFRLQEKKVIHDILVLDKPVVIATGGGSILDKDTRINLRKNSRVFFWMPVLIHCISDL